MTTAATVRRFAAATPDSRNRVTDAARALAIVVVLAWHWAFAVYQRRTDGSLAMPGVFEALPWAWPVTWVLQVMPLFFLVGGYAAAAAGQSARNRGEPPLAVVRARLRRVLLPTAAWAACWLAVEAVAAARPGEHRYVWEWFPGYLTPLWFLGLYVLLVAGSPVLTGRRWSGLPALLGLAAAMSAAAVLARLQVPGAALLASMLVWLLLWQLGMAWQRWHSSPGRSRCGAAAVAIGLVALVVLTEWLGYPRSMVAAGGGDSNMWPTTPAIAAVGVLQLGLVLLATPQLERALRHLALWTPVVAVNAVAMTVFLWHMTALLAVLLAGEALGLELRAQVDGAWWAQRPLWVLGPLAVLLALVAAFGRVEAAARRPVVRAARGSAAGRARARGC